MPNGTIRVGTSGWNYSDWRGAFYPPEVPGRERLAHYARVFPTVELNSSFYSLPAPDAVERWLQQTPAGFSFACKASRYLTHMKKLKDPDEGLRRLFQALEPFGARLGPILFQLPGNWRVDAGRLQAFLAALPAGHRYAFEFRDRSWLCEDIYRLLAKHESALCLYDYQRYRPPAVTTAGFVYVRLHGPGAEAYGGAYDGRTLAGWARRFRRWAAEGRDVYCYFDNDQQACAPGDARRLTDSLARQGGGKL